MKWIADLILQVSESADVVTRRDDRRIDLIVPAVVTKEERRAAYAIRIDRSYGFLPTLSLCPDNGPEQLIPLPLLERLHLWRAIRTLLRRIRDHDNGQLRDTLRRLIPDAHPNSNVQGDRSAARSSGGDAGE